MEYGIRELAEMAGVSARTLRWYDQLGLLKPARVGENGYRFYSEREVNRLQHILFYREMGLELKTISGMLDDPSFDRMTALRDHLRTLEQERNRTDRMIACLKRTIEAEERNEDMAAHEKFEAFKRNAINENEVKYGKEARRKYGDEAVNASNAHMMNMTEDQYDEWQRIGVEIQSRLESAVQHGLSADSPEGTAIAELHKQWLRFTWSQYTVQAHAGVAEMYIMDERFTQYYDANVPGCARFLRDAVKAWLNR